MNSNTRLYWIVTGVVLGVIVLCLSATGGQDRKTYEVPMQIYGIPANQSDAARAVAAYERLVERYADLTERNLGGVAVDLKALATRLDTIDARLISMDTRLARIEQRLGIVPPKPAAPDPNLPLPSATPGDDPSPSSR